MNFVIYILLTAFLTWYIKTQKIFEYIFFNDFLKHVRECWFCLGFWVCFILYWIFNINILDFLYTSDNIIVVRIVGSLVTAIFISTLNFYLVDGIKKNHTIIHIK